MPGHDVAKSTKIDNHFDVAGPLFERLLPAIERNTARY